MIADGIEATMATLIGLMARQFRWQEAMAMNDEKAAARQLGAIMTTG